MGYAIIPIGIRTVNNEPLFVTDVPVKDLTESVADVLTVRAAQLWPVLMAQTLNQFDAYANEKLWPAVRAEVDRVTAQTEERVSAASKQVTWYGLIAVVALGAAGAYLYSRRKGALT
jgi:hypothetical protein